MRYEFRPLTWTDKETPSRRGAHLFKASWDSTLDLLVREIEFIGGTDLIVVQVDAAESQIRQDGMLYARAKVNHPGVAISFVSKFGPLRYATDAYEDSWYSSKGLTGWQANVRAIALALEALRAVDRYGVTKRGEQYTGWRAIAAPASEFGNVTDARQWMREYAAEIGIEHVASLDIPLLYRRMAKVMHPDTGAPRADWDRLDAARQLLDIR